MWFHRSINVATELAVVLTYYRDEHEWEGPGGALPSQARGTVDGSANKGYVVIALSNRYLDNTVNKDK